MPVIVRMFSAYLRASQLKFVFFFTGSQLQYVTNGLGVRYRRTKSTITTDWESVPYRTEVNPL